MSPQIEAALIAGVVSLISLGGTVIVAAIGFRTTKSVTGSTLAEQHTQTLNARFATAAEQLGNDQPPNVRLAGVHAMAGLADDWEDNRQTCIDVLCAYLRMPYALEPGGGEQAQLVFQADREVRRTVIRVITRHLRDGGAKASWQDKDFDFTGVVFDGGDFSDAKFSGGQVDFSDAKFSGVVSFGRVEFARGQVSFSRAEFATDMVDFIGAVFYGGLVYFTSAVFSGGLVYFTSATISDGLIDFTSAKFTGQVQVNFGNTTFSGGEVRFGAEFSGSQVYFSDATFSGSQIDFSDAKFSGPTVVDLSNPAVWTHPPAFMSPLPKGLKLPQEPAA